MGEKMEDSLLTQCVMASVVKTIFSISHSYAIDRL